jgi:hypothetical protein
VKTTVLSILILSAFCGAAGASRVILGDYGSEYLTGSVDTVYHGKFKLIIRHGGWGGETGVAGLDIISGYDTLSVANDAVYFYDFCRDTLVFSTDCIFRDINKNRLEDIIIDVYWGGMHCCHEVYAIELSNPPKMLSKIGVDVATLEEKDLDRDSLPEFWHWCWQSPEGYVPIYLVWKWDGEKYRLANYKLKNYFTNDSLFCKTCLLNSMARVDSTYKPDFKNYTYPDPEFWDLINIYAFYGRPEMIDSVFNEYWPDYNPGKKDAHDRFMASLKINDIWQQLQDSDW